MFERRSERGDIATGLHHWTDENNFEVYTQRRDVVATWDQYPTFAITQKKWTGHRKLQCKRWDSGKRRWEKYD